MELASNVIEIARKTGRVIVLVGLLAVASDQDPEIARSYTTSTNTSSCNVTLDNGLQETIPACLDK